MKKHYILVILACALVTLVPSRNSIVSAHDEDDAGSDVKVELRESNSIRAKAPTAVERLEKLRMEQEIKLKERLNATSSMRTGDDRMDDRMENRMEDKRPVGINARVASSTLRERMESRMENVKKLRMDEFKKRQKNIVSQLERALNNLKQIRSRLVSRIEKAESSGRDMTEPRRLITIADTKIDLAAKGIADFASHNASTTTASATTTVESDDEVDLTKPRQINVEVIKSIKDAHRALVDVVISIAHNMGVKCSRDDDSIHCEANTTVEATTTTP